MNLEGSAERLSILRSVNRLHTAVRELPDTDRICELIKGEFSRFIPFDMALFLRYPLDGATVQVLACSDAEQLNATSIALDDSSEEWLRTEEHDKISTYSDLESAPGFVRDISGIFGSTVAVVYLGRKHEYHRDLILMTRKELSEQPGGLAEEDLIEFFKGAALALENAQTMIELNAIKNNLQSLFDLAPVGILIVDRRGATVNANRQAMKILGSDASVDDLLEDNLLEGENYKGSGISALIQRALSGEECEAENVRFKTDNDRSCHLHIRFRPISYGSGEMHALGVVTDISQRHRLLHQLERSYQTLTDAFQELQRVDKMKTQFIDVVSHELRTPLTVMRGYIELLEARDLDKLDPKVAQKIQYIKQHTEKLNTLVESMLDVARIEKGAMEISKHDTSVTALVEQVVAAQKPLADEKKQELTIVTVGKLPIVRMDSRKMRDAIRNVINNAIKYTPENGKIQVGVADEGKMIHIWVKDNGVGIPLSELERIFDRFYIVAAKELSHQVDRMGLGLPIAKGIVESHGGKVWIESEVGKGTVFHINFPK